MTIILIGGTWAQAQVTTPPTSEDVSRRPPTAVADTPSSEPWTGGKVSLVRGVLKRLDPIHDQLLIRPFGGGDLRIAFDTRTQLLHENSSKPLTSLPPGSVLSIDTVVDHGKLFARSVRADSSGAGELKGLVVRYDAATSRLTIGDPMNSKNISLRMTSATEVVSQGRPSSPQALSPGTLVGVRFSPIQNEVKSVEILVERGKAFTFTGPILAVDLRARVVVLSNDSDQSVAELAIGSLDTTSLRLLREGADVSIQAEFDGERYNASTVTLVTPHP